MAQTVKTENPALRVAIEHLRRSGLPVPRQEFADRFEVSTGTVQAVRAQIDREIAAEPVRPVAGRTVMEFDGPRLFELRRARWLMQDALGKMAKVSRGEIGHLERTPTGTRSEKWHRKPTLRTMLRLAEALGVEPEDLLELPWRTDTPARALLEMRDAQRHPGGNAQVLAALEDDDEQQALA
jgi:transcriptional regulator with XRE-family HTH domain